MSLFIGKCLSCKRLFQASTNTNVGTLELAGERFRAEICDNCARELASRKRAAEREARP